MKVFLIKPCRFTHYNFFWLITTCLFINSAGWAQSFRFEAPVDAVQQSGFHQILLPPDLVGRLNTHLTDIRLYDGQHQEVPYLLVRQQPIQTALFADYELVSKQSRPNKSTTLVIRNQTKQPIHSLALVIKNTNVSKKAQLSGSSDAQNWYAIDDEIWLGPTQNRAATTETKQIDFPLSDYAYYRLVINDSLSTPLNILRTGYYAHPAPAGTYSAIPDLSFSQRDSSDKKTYIHLAHPVGVCFDKLNVVVQSAAPFRRRADIGQFRTRKLKRGRIDHWFEIIRSIELSSVDSNVVNLPGIKAKDLFIIIANDDNPPLVVRNVQAYQLKTYLLANLTAGKFYQLHFSADDGLAPSYDPTPFNAVTPANQPVIRVGSFHSLDTTRKESTSFFTDSRIIWPALGIVLLVLGILSYRMIREMEKANG